MASANRVIGGSPRELPLNAVYLYSISGRRLVVNDACHVARHIPACLGADAGGASKPRYAAYYLAWRSQLDGGRNG